MMMMMSKQPVVDANNYYDFTDSVNDDSSEASFRSGKKINQLANGADFDHIERQESQEWRLSVKKKSDKNMNQCNSDPNAKASVTDLEQAVEERETSYKHGSKEYFGIKK
jgi:hypothetical protein